MGQAKLRGSFEQRQAAAVEMARVRDEAALQARTEKKAQQERDVRIIDDPVLALFQSPRRVGANKRTALMLAGLLGAGSFK